MGGNSQYHAIHRRPDLFASVRCMVSPMVVSMAAIYDAFPELPGVRQYQELVDLELLKMEGCCRRNDPASVGRQPEDARPHGASAEGCLDEKS